MLEQFIMNLDFAQAKQLLRTYRIDLTDDEIHLLLPIIKNHFHELKDEQKRQSLIRTLPSSLQGKIYELLNRYQHLL